MPSDGGGVVPLCVGANMSSSVEEGSDSMIQVGGFFYFYSD